MMGKDPSTWGKNRSKKTINHYKDRATHAKRFPGCHELSNHRWHQLYMRLVNFYFCVGSATIFNFFGENSIFLCYFIYIRHFDWRIDFLCKECPRPTIVIKKEKKKEKRKDWKREKMKTSLTGPCCCVQRKTFRFSKVRTLFFLNGPPSQCILIISIYFSLKKNSWF